MADGSANHWFYLPKSDGWDVFSQPQPEILTKLQESLEITPAMQVQLVGLSGGQLVTPENNKLQEIQGLEGIVTVYKVEPA
jgi:hypothetical protein